jgi:hypothetical protein
MFHDKIEIASVFDKFMNKNSKSPNHLGVDQVGKTSRNKKMK